MTFNGVTFEWGCDMIDATRNGLFGGPADTSRRMVPGAKWYRVNGEDVSEEEFQRRLAEAKAAQSKS